MIKVRHISSKINNAVKINVLIAYSIYGALSLPMVTYSLVNTPSQQSDTSFNTYPNGYVSYLYAPGMMATELAMGRYCPEFTAVTGEKFKFKLGGNVIGQPHSAVQFPEIDFKKPSCFTWNPIKAYFNRIRNDLYPLFARLFKEKYKFEVEENSDSSLSVINYSVNFGQANAGQTKDIHAVNQTYQDHLSKYPGMDIVLFGDSRGATTMFNFIAEYKPSGVKAAILESPYDDMRHYIKHLFYSDKGEAAENRLLSLFGFLAGSYDKNGPTAREYAQIITDDIPLLFVISLQDGLVNPQCTMYLYGQLKERGHQNIHLLVLKKSGHPSYMLDNKEDKDTYESVVHAFYKHYGLPHNETLALKGQTLFQATQPSVQALHSYDLPQCHYCLQ